MKENPKVAVGEIANTIGISASVVQYHVEKLKNEKRIKRVGADNGGQWKVKWRS